MLATTSLSTWAAVTPESLAEQLAEHAAPCGRFEQSRWLSDLDTTLESSGIYQRHGGSLIWETRRPIEDRVILAPDSPDLQPGMKAMLPVFTGLLSGDWTSLERHFSIHLEGTQQNWQAELVPRDRVVAEQLLSMMVGGGAQVSQLTLTFANDDQLVLKLHPLDCPHTDDGASR